MDKSLEHFYRFLIQNGIRERIRPKSLQDIIFYIEMDLNTYLKRRDAYWLDEDVKRKDWQSEVKKLSSVQDFNEYFLNLEKSLASIYYFSEEEWQEPK